MFAQAWSDLNLHSGLFLVVKIIATIAGAFIGWFVCDPLTRLAYRIVKRTATPGWLLPWTKLAGAATLALTVWLVMPSGSGGEGGGGGFWPFGGSPDKGTGEGNNPKSTVPKETKTVSEEVTTQTKKATPQQETVKIEIVPIVLDKKDGKKRYFLVNGIEPAKYIDELRVDLQKNPGKIKVNIVLTERTPVGKNKDTDPVQQLRHVLNELKIDHLEINTAQ